MRGIFLLGTDTSVGKTEIACRLVRQLQLSGLRVGAYKPACSGSEVDSHGYETWSDVERLYAALDGQFPRDLIAPQCFSAALAPPHAAARQNARIDPLSFTSGFHAWESSVDLLVVEGAGGILSPLSETLSNADLAKILGIPVLIIGRAGLGTINHTRLTIFYAQQLQLNIAGVILSETERPSDPDLSRLNAAEIAHLTSVPVLGIYPFQEPENLGVNLQTNHGLTLIPTDSDVTIEWIDLLQKPTARSDNHGR
jgi:dethiobiotin synthetase